MNETSEKAARFPFGIPNGWYLVAYSEDLTPGSVRRLHYLDRDLVAFRTAETDGSEGSSLGVLDAYCPHLGAHLGVGGTVEGDGLRCPFHGWRWATDGRCLEVPYATRIPAGARAESLPVVERNGMVFVWHDAQGSAPSWQPPDIAEWHDDGWLRPWLRYEWTVKTHPQEMGENGIDWPHFQTVHHMSMPEQRGFEFNDHVYRWSVGAAKQVSTLAGAPDSVLMHGENWGLGYSWLRQTSAFFDTVVATGLTPIDAETTHVQLGVIARQGEQGEADTREQLRSYMDEHAVVAQQDFPIWENKIYREDPLLCDGDGPISAYRRWAQQFYPKS